MAHTKAGGSSRQKGNRVGRRLGIKIFGGEKVIPGNIIVRQRGSTFHAGTGVKQGRDYTIYAVKSGQVVYKKSQNRQYISVV